MNALRDVGVAVATLYALVLLYVGYLHACKRATAWADARRMDRLTTPQKGETP